MEESIILEEVVIMYVIKHWAVNIIEDNYYFLFNTYSILIRKIIAIINNQDSNYNIISDPILLSDDKLTISRILSSAKTSCNITHAIERLKEISYIMFMYNYLKDLDRLIDNNYNINKTYIQSKIRCMIQEFNDKFNSIEDENVLDSSNIDEYVDRLLFSGELRYVLSGISELDIRLGGIRCGDLTVIGARPSVGKTTFCINMMLKHSMNNQNNDNVKNILYVSPDMNIRYVYEKLICGYKKITREQLLQEKNSDNVKKTLRSMPIIVTDTNIFEDICSIIEINKKRLSAIVIDYIQLIYNEVNITSSRQEQIGKMIIKLKSICKKNNIAIVLVSQMNRECEKRKDESFLLSDLRDSGYLEQEADLIIFLDKIRGTGKIKIIVSKNRHGSSFEIESIIDYAFSNIQ